MRKFFSAIKAFFFPPPGVSRWLRLLPFGTLGMVTVLALYGASEAWTYTNSPNFCGTTCHTMPPEYSTYLRSPHARVQCVECHIGRDVFTTQFSRKAGDLRHVALMLTQEYEFPIHTRNMRPASDSCERCHFPQKFSDDSMRELISYGNDEANSTESTILLLKTGGGSKREGLGRGIHWHIENEVWYYATDELQQEIPYVRVIEENGEISEYYDIATDFGPEDVAGQYLQRVDCITCHNRITHAIASPESAVDLALSKELISTDLPFVREQAVGLLTTTYPDTATAHEAFTSLADFYKDEYPQLATDRSDEIQQAIDTVSEIYSQSNYPEQKLDWNTHPDNLGHSETPGCFRCHDGKHLTGTEEAIRLECNLCHAVPVVQGADSLVTEIELARGPEPPSHTLTNWMTLHGKAIDTSCAACHQPEDPGMDYTELEGKPPAGDYFCGNTACHANSWTFTGFEYPGLEPILARQLYVLRNTSPYLLGGVPLTYADTFQAMFEGRCTSCHSGPRAEAGLDLSSYAMMLAGGQNGPSLIPGAPADSLIIQRQSGPSDHFGQVLDEELEALQEWIAAGAP